MIAYQQSTGAVSGFIQRYMVANPQNTWDQMEEQLSVIFSNVTDAQMGGRTGLMVRASDSGSGDPGSILGWVGVFVSLSKRHLLPKSTGNTKE